MPSATCAREQMLANSIAPAADSPGGGRDITKGLFNTRRETHASLEQKLSER